MSYWRNRELNHIKQSIENDERIARRIRRNQQRAMNDIETQIEAFYGRYADVEGISMSEARKRVSKLDVEKYSDKAKQYVKERNFSKMANEQMRIYNVTMNINRLELLKANIHLELLAMTSEEQRVLFEEMTKSARAEYERQAGILGETLNYNEKNIASIVNSSFLSAEWSDRLWDNQDALRSELDRLLNRSIVQGRNPREMARELRKTFDTSIFNSERLLITETARVQQDVFQDSMKQAEIEQYEYIAELSACDICAALDGKIFDVDDAESGRNAYPMHPFCKCSQAAYIDRDAWEREMDERELTGEEEKERITFSDSVKGDMTEEQYKVLEDIVNEAPEEIQQLWLKHQEDLVTYDSNSKKGFYSQGQGVHFNFAEDSQNESVYRRNGERLLGKENYTTFFHEHGHHVDSLFGFDDVRKMKFRNPVTKKMVTQEVKVWSYKSKELNLADTLRKEIKEVMSKYDTTSYYGLVPKLREYAQTEYPFGHSGVSDIISGLTKGQSSLGWSHPKRYWTSNPETLNRETFAHMFQARTMGGQSEEFMMEMFPETYEKFVDFIKEAAKQ